MKPRRKPVKVRRRRLEFADAFARVLEKKRTAKKLSRQALAEKAGVHQTYVGMIERGLSNPSLNAAHAIAKALQVPFSRLVAQAESLRERVQAVETALHGMGTPTTPAEIAKQFKRAKPAAVLEILQTLVTLGRARKQGGQFTR